MRESSRKKSCDAGDFDGSTRELFFPLPCKHVMIEVKSTERQVRLLAFMYEIKEVIE